jgi:hypothetical protein
MTPAKPCKFRTPISRSHLHGASVKAIFQRGLFILEQTYRNRSPASTYGRLRPKTVWPAISLILTIHQSGQYKWLGERPKSTETVSKRECSAQLMTFSLISAINSASALETMQFCCENQRPSFVFTQPRHKAVTQRCQWPSKRRPNKAAWGLCCLRLGRANMGKNPIQLFRIDRLD